MSSSPIETSVSAPRRPLALDVAILVLAGAGLGLAFNAVQRAADPTRGLPWIHHERRILALDDGPATFPPPAPAAVPDHAVEARVPASRPAAPAAPVRPAAPHAGVPVPAASPPPAHRAPPADSAQAGVPPVPDAPEPIEARLVTVRKLYAANAAVFIDARGADEFAQSHIAGAVSLPFDEAFKDPARLKRFDAGGKPIVTYCGGGDCDLSRNLAFALLDAGKHRVLVYLGGLPEWKQAGLPVAGGSAP